MEEILLYTNNIKHTRWMEKILNHLGWLKL